MNSHALPRLCRWVLRSLAAVLALGCLTARGSWTVVHQDIWGADSPEYFEVHWSLETDGTNYRLGLRFVSTNEPHDHYTVSVAWFDVHDESIALTTDGTYLGEPAGGGYGYGYDSETDTYVGVQPKLGAVRFQIDVSSQSNGPVPPFSYTLPVDTFGLTFHLPANTGSRAITYIATKNLGGGVIVSVSSHTQLPGAAAFDFYVGGLSNTTGVDLQQVTGGYVSGSGSSTGLILPGNSAGQPPTQYVTVSTGTTPTLETSTGSGASASASVTVSDGAGAGPVHTGASFGTVEYPSAPPNSGGSGSTASLTRGDLESARHDIVAAIDRGATGQLAQGNEIIKGLGAVVGAVEDNGARMGKPDGESEAARAAAGTGSVSGGSAAASAASAQYGTVTGGAHTGLGYTPGDGTAPNLTVTMPASFGGKVFDLNPFTSDRLGPIASWFKGAVAWLVVVGIGAWVWNELDVKAYQAATLRQAQGNAVAGGTGAQVTALTAAAAITTIIVSLATALLGWAFGEITFPAIVTAMGTNPVSSMPAGVLWMVNQVLPVATIISALLARLSWKMYCVPLFAAAAALVRFVVP